MMWYARARALLRTVPQPSAELLEQFYGKLDLDLRPEFCDERGHRRA